MPWVERDGNRRSWNFLARTFSRKTTQERKRGRTEKKDIFNEVRKGTFLKSFDTGLSRVLIFSPGGGMVREVYAAQLEDLASHGYVVAAISHPYDAIVTIFPDGRQVAYSGQRWPKPPSLEGEANLNQLEWHANDMRLVLDELNRANVTGPTALPFAGHLDLDHVGAFGHSFGGIAAAHACQIDRRLKACLDEDGVVAKKPFYLHRQQHGCLHRRADQASEGEGGRDEQDRIEVLHS